MIKITEDLATISDCIKMKKHGDFAKCRDTAKVENFSLMFGAKPSTFRSMLQYRSKFSVEDCKSYIKLTNNMALYQDICKQADDGYFKREYEFRKDVECWFLAAATVMRENFLDGYKGLRDRILREQAEALRYYMSWNWYGAVRWHPELAYMDIDPMTGKVKGLDKQYSSGTFNHMMNDAANTNIQTGETVFIYGGWINIQDYYDEWKLRTQLFNSIHDSLDNCVYKPEKELVKSLITTCVGGPKRYPFEGIHHRMDSEVSDIRDYDHLKKTFYKHGEEEKTAPLEDSLKEFNEKYKPFGQPELKYHGCVC